jgi:hypothetical protein
MWGFIIITTKSCCVQTVQTVCVTIAHLYKIVFQIDFEKEKYLVMRLYVYHYNTLL